MVPLGDYTKTEVREIANRFGLHVAAKPDSQNFVCGDYASIIKSEPNPGPILDNTGNILGQHRGIQFYTIGQHKGLGLPTQKPLYVTSLDPVRNAVITGVKEDIYKDEFIVSELNWMAIEEIDKPMIMSARIRSSHKEAEAIITPIDTEHTRVKFKEPQLAITPGQASVFYQDDLVIGAGIIQQVS